MTVHDNTIKNEIIKGVTNKINKLLHKIQNK